MLKLLYIKEEKIDIYTTKLIHTFIDDKGRHYELIDKYQWKPLQYANKYLQCKKPS